jgi:non-ribosomal peptide synthetase component F
VLRGIIEDQGKVPFKAFLKSMRQTIINALMYQDYPFGLIVQRMQQHREKSRSPLFQVLFVHEKVHHSHTVLTPFMMGEAGGKMQLADLQLESMDLKQKIAQYDLVFAIAEYENGRMDVTLQYNCDLFNKGTIEGFGRQWLVLLQAALSKPTTHLCDLPLWPRTTCGTSWKNSTRPSFLFRRSPGVNASIKALSKR